MKTTIATTNIKPAGFSPSASDETRRLPRLLGWLYKAAADRGESKIELARQLGVTYGYLAQLASGMRATESIAPSISRSCAIYLGVPAVAVMLAAGVIQTRDFLLPESGRSPAAQLNAGLERIAADPLVGCLMPPEVWDVPDSVKGMLVALYEDSTKQELFPPRELPALFQALQDAAEVLHDLDAADDAAAIPDGPGSMRTLPI